MEKRVQLKCGKVEGLLQGLVSLNGIDIQDGVQILNVAENINRVRAALEQIHSMVEKIAGDVSTRTVLAGNATQENPQVEFNRRRGELLAKDYEITLWTIPVELLLDGPKKASPGAVAELMPLLRNVENVRLPKN